MARNKKKNDRCREKGCTKRTRASGAHIFCGEHKGNLSPETQKAWELYNKIEKPVGSAKRGIQRILYKEKLRASKIPF